MSIETIKFDFKDQKNEAFDFFKKNGYAVLKNVVELSYLENIKKELSFIIEQQCRKHLPKSTSLLEGNGFDKGLIELAQHDDLLRRRIYEIIHNLPSLYKLATDSPYLKIVEELGMQKPILMPPQIRMDLPNDKRFLQGEHQEVNCIKSPNMIHMLVALVDTPPNKGALGVSPGSHQLGVLKPAVNDERRYQYIPRDQYQQYPYGQLSYNFGEAILLDMYTIHGSFLNTLAEIRWSVSLRAEDLANLPFLDGDDSYLNYSLKG